MTWEDRLELLKYHANAEDEKRRLADNARNTLADFADELVNRYERLIELYTINGIPPEEPTLRTIISQLLIEVGVER